MALAPQGERAPLRVYFDVVGDGFESSWISVARSWMVNDESVRVMEWMSLFQSFKVNEKRVRLDLTGFEGDGSCSAEDLRLLFGNQMSSCRRRDLLGRLLLWLHPQITESFAVDSAWHTTVCQLGSNMTGEDECFRRWPGAETVDLAIAGCRAEMGALNASELLWSPFILLGTLFGVLSLAHLL